MERCCQSRLPNDECATTWMLVMEELRGCQCGCENCLWRHCQSHERQPHLKVTLCELGVVGQNQERYAAGQQILHELCCSWNKYRAFKDHSIHIRQVILDVLHALPSIVCYIS